MGGLVGGEGAGETFVRLIIMLLWPNPQVFPTGPSVAINVGPLRLGVFFQGF